MRALERDNRKEADRRLKEARDEYFKNKAERERKETDTQPKGETAP